jgi:hypothetical protein
VRDTHLIDEALLTVRHVSGKGWARVNCPFCVDRAGKDDRTQCLAISMETGWYRCWRCEAKGRVNVPEHMRVVGAVNTPVEVHGVDPPDGFIPLYDGQGATAICAEPAREYLARRGLAPGMWAEAGIGCCVGGHYGGRVVVPVLDPAGMWIGWVGRAWNKRAAKKYLNAPGMSLGGAGRLYNERALDGDRLTPVAVVEGVFDSLALWPDAVAVLGKPTEEQLKTLLSSRRPVAVVLDGDAWEQSEMTALWLRFCGQRAGFVKLPPCVDPDEVPRKLLMDAIGACIGAEGGINV